MANAPVIVNYAQLAGPHGLEGVMQEDPRPDSDADRREQAKMRATVLWALSQLEREQIDPEVLTAPDDQTASVLQSALAQKSEELGALRGLDAGGKEARFDNQDRRWIRSLFGLIRDKLNVGRFDFLPQPDAPTELPNRARVAILGDWGTGLYGAPKCAESIERDAAGIQAVVHLGDVYYSGTKEEISERFHTLWPQVPGAISRACNSNHEMYSGGKPYAEITLPRFKQSSSLWWLENDHWALIGLDTAYDEFAIGRMQADWVRLLSADARRDGKRVILFSHHQLFSHFKEQGHHIAEKLSDVLEDHRVFAWYWGHEHLCTVFDAHPRWGTLGRCIGHGGFPYGRPRVGQTPVEATGPGGVKWHRVPSREGAPSGIVLDGPNCEIRGKEDKFGPNGYAVLELDDDHVVEVVVSPDGEELYRKQLA